MNMHNSKAKKIKKDGGKNPQFVRDDRKDERKRRIFNSRLGGLQYVANGMNTFKGQYATEDKEWEMAEKIVEEKSLSKQIGRFNEWAKKYPVELVIEKDGKLPRPFESSPSEQANALLHLWRYYFRDEGWIRLKRCPQCKEWFVDSTRNRSAIRCSVGCNDLWWSRNRRKKANHKHQKVGGTSNGTERR